jgi:hypothetical protein
LANILERLSNRFLLVEHCSEGIIGVAVDNVLIHVGKCNRTAYGVKMIAVPAGGCRYGQESIAVDIFVGDPG